MKNTEDSNKLDKVGNIIPITFSKINKYDIQDLFTSACAYFDIKNIEKYIGQKIIPNIQHFYILMTAYVGVKERMNILKDKFKRDKYRYHAPTIFDSYCSKSETMKVTDFYFEYMIPELINILKLFILNGFVL